MENILDQFRQLDELDRKISDNQSKKIFFVDNPAGIKKNNEEIKEFTIQELDATTRIKQYMNNIGEEDKEAIQQEFQNKVSRIGMRWKMMLMDDGDEDDEDYLASTQQEIELTFLKEQQNDFKDIELDLKELFLVFKQIQILVSDCAPQLDQVEKHVEESVAQTDMAVHEMDEAIEYDRKWRKKRCIILMIIIIAIIIVIVISVATPLAIKA